MITVREAILDDLDDLISLNEEVQRVHSAEQPEIFKEAPARSDLADFFRPLIGNSASHIYLAFKDEQPLGYVFCNVIERGGSALTHAMIKIHLEHIAVKTSNRREGIGRALMDRVRVLSKEMGASHISLESWLFNTNAIAFFEKSGFKQYSSLMWSGE